MAGQSPSRSILGASWLLAGLATLALEVARLGYVERPLLSALGTIVTFAVVLGGSAWFCRLRTTEARSILALALLAIFTPLPVLVDLAGRRWFHSGQSAEIVQLLMLRNGMLALAALSLWPRVLRLSCVISLFLMLGSLVLLTGWLGHVVTAVYGLVGIWWLLGANWERIDSQAVSQTRRRIPWSIVGGSAASILTAAVIAGCVLGGTQSAVALGGFWWGSGGTQSSDAFAARGVGDGDQVIGAQSEAASFGAVESELFLDSDRPSLYDMFNDQYGEPVTKKQQERAVGLAGAPPTHSHRRMATSEAGGREFSTVRRQTAQPPTELNDRETEALLYVSGRVPLHLRLETFDAFDGTTWRHARADQNDKPNAWTFMNTVGGQPWLDIRRGHELVELCPEERHTLKIQRLATNRIPTPAHLAAAHIDKVAEREFYAWAADDVLEMPGREQIPALQVIHLRSRSCDPARMQRRKPVKPTPSSDALSRLARKWTAGVPEGWPQVAAIAGRLRSTEFTLDRQATLPANCAGAAEHFLLEGRRGPDYLFATSATLLLRSLGYEARLATGLYANPERYERLARHTPVLPADVHFWSEVTFDGSTWITVEPSPGYEVLPPRRTWSESVVAFVIAGCAWILAHPALSLLALAAVAVAILFRRDAIDLAFTTAWLLDQAGSTRQQVLATIRLLERRARLAGRPRPAHATLPEWYRQAAVAPGPAGQALHEFLTHAARALYAPSMSAMATYPAVDNARRDCRRTVILWTVRKLRSLRHPPTRPSAP